MTNTKGAKWLVNEEIRKNRSQLAIPATDKLLIQRF